MPSSRPHVAVESGRAAVARLGSANAEEKPECLVDFGLIKWSRLSGASNGESNPSETLRSVA